MTQVDKVIDPLQTPPEPIECPWCQSKYAPRLYGWHERADDGHYQHRYTVRCLNCGAQGPKKEIGPHAIAAWNRRADDADRARLVAQAEDLRAASRITDAKLTGDLEMARDRIRELEKQLAWKEGLIRQLTEVDMPALEGQLATLQAACAGVT